MTDIKAIEGRLSAATPGPWEIVIDKHPCYLGGPHLERRIFTVWEHPQVGESLGIVNNSMGAPQHKGGDVYNMVAINEQNADFIAHAPTDIRHLLDEVNRLEHSNRVLVENNRWFANKLSEADND